MSRIKGLLAALLGIALILVVTGAEASDWRPGGAGWRHGHRGHPHFGPPPFADHRFGFSPYSHAFRPHLPPPGFVVAPVWVWVPGSWQWTGHTWVWIGGFWTTS